jgi:hypothetical protein
MYVLRSRAIDADDRYRTASSATGRAPAVAISAPAAL